MGKVGTSSSSPGFGHWFPFLVHQVPIVFAQPDGSSSCSVCHLRPFQTNCSGERGCLQPVCRDNVCLYLKMYSAWKDSSICSCSAFSGYWAVANGGCLQGFFNSATFGQVVTQVEKNVLVCQSWHVKGLLSQTYLKSLFQNWRSQASSDKRTRTELNVGRK